MKRIIKQLKDQNVFIYVSLIGATIVLMISILIGYLYGFYYDTIRNDFCVSNEIYLGAIADKHERDMQIMDDIVLQLGISNNIMQFRLEDDPIKGLKLKERLYQYMQVTGFAHDMICAYSKDNYLFNDASSHEKDHFFRFGLLLEKTNPEQLEEMLYKTGKHKIILEEQQAEGYLMSSSSGISTKVICILYPIRPNYVSTMLFVIDGYYYDDLLCCTEGEKRENCLVYNDQIVVRRGNLNVSDEELSFALAKCNNGQSKMQIAGKQYMIFAEQGESGIFYYTLQPMKVFYDKMITKQWGMLALLVLCCIPTTMLLIYLGHKLILRIKSINALLDEEEGYSLNRLEEKVNTLMGDSQRMKEENLVHRRSKFIECFIKNEFGDVEEMIRAGNDAQICVDYRFFVVLLMRADKNVYQEIVKLIVGKDAVKGYGMTMLHKNQILFVLFGESSEQVMQVILEIFNIGKENKEFAMSASSIHQDYLEAPKAYLEANAALNSCFFIDNSRILFYEEALGAKQRIKLPVSYIQNLRSAIMKENREKLTQVILEICGKIGEENCTVLAVQFLFMDLIRLLMQECSTGKELSECVDIFLLSRCSTMQDFKNYLHQVCEWMIDEGVLSDTNNMNIVRDAVDYMEKHFSNTELNIAELSRQLGLNQTELGRKFRAQLGINPSDFLVQVRMEHAKKMLENTDMLVKEISKAVGYEDDHVFMKRFKKYTELTPNQYRTSRLQSK